MLQNDAIIVFGEQLYPDNDIPDLAATDISPIIRVNDELGFDAVHKLFDHTINNLKNLLTNYEHTTDPYETNDEPQVQDPMA
jgi:hypothetical protein